MISVMNTNLESSSDRKDDVVGEEPTVSLDIDGGNDSSGGLGFYSVGLTEEEVRVSLENADRLDNTRVCDTTNEAMISEPDNEETSFGVAGVGALENKPSSSVSKMQGNGKKTDIRNGKSEYRKVTSVVHDYDSMLSAFDEFAAKDKDEAVGYGYEIGDMVWGKVKSHPWWPGRIYNEEYASPSVRRSKREGHVLVAFFGDGSYGWFLPAELIPFEENFAEKSRQTNLRSFLHAVGEAVDELSRRRSLGLACRCRNEFNFWPSNSTGYFVVDVGDYEPMLYSSSQISKARDTFQPREMLSFIQQLALTPRNHPRWTIEFVKNKATVLACRRSMFEEFDETYAQAFGTVPLRPPRPTAPVAVDPSKAPLSGRLVFAEALGKEEIFIKTTKTKDQAEKEKYLFKRRDEPTKKPKKSGSGRSGALSNRPSVGELGFSGRVSYFGMDDLVHQNYESGATDGQHQSTSHQASIVSELKPLEGSRKLDTGIKKGKVPKRPLGKLSAENAMMVEKKKKKRKKERIVEASADLLQLPVAINNSGVVIEKVSGTPPPHIPLIDNYLLDNQNKDVVGATSSKVEAQQLAVDVGSIELQMLLRDLRALALNPFHGMDRNCPGVVRPVFLKFRSLVYQKSLVLAPTETEASEAHSGISLPSTTPLVGSVEKINNKINELSTVKAVKPLVRTDDPTKGGRKRGPLDLPEGIKKKKKIDDSEAIKKKKFNDLADIKKKKINDSEGIKKKKINESENMMKKKINEMEDIKKMKKIDESKSSASEKRPSQRSTESHRGDVIESFAKNVPPTLPKAAKLESTKKVEHPVRAPNPTMLVMKFPAGAGLPSGAELRARFARFGPMDHSATRVFWKSYTCRLVYHYMDDAQAALKFINGNNVFGNINVRCHLRDLLAEAAESESAKVQKEDLPSVGVSHLRDSAVEQRIATAQLVQQSVQLKSCLKKPSGDEGGNGGVRGTRVKFALGGEETSKNEHVFIGNKNIINNNIATFPEGASSSMHSMDVNSKNLPMFISHSATTVISQPQPQPQPQPPPPRLFHPIMPTVPVNNDISQELLNLLKKCSDVVNNLSGILGYVPYRPL